MSVSIRGVGRVRGGFGWRGGLGGSPGRKPFGWICSLGGAEDLGFHLKRTRDGKSDCGFLAGITQEGTAKRRAGQTQIFVEG